MVRQGHKTNSDDSSGGMRDILRNAFYLFITVYRICLYILLYNIKYCFPCKTVGLNCWTFRFMFESTGFSTRFVCRKHSQQNKPLSQWDLFGFLLPNSYMIWIERIVFNIFLYMTMWYRSNGYKVSAIKWIIEWFQMDKKKLRVENGLRKWHQFIIFYVNSFFLLISCDLTHASNENSI